MDNFLSWIFLIIWIIFFISQFLGKNKKQNPQQNNDQNRNDDFSLDTIFSDSQEQTKSERIKTKEEILRDIFYNTDFDDRYSEHKKTEEINYDTFSTVREKVSDFTAKNKKILKSPTLKTDNKKEVKAAVNFLEKLKDPESLKEAILLAEILGKPKALRGRWQRNLF